MSEIYQNDEPSLRGILVYYQNKQSFLKNFKPGKINPFGENSWKVDSLLERKNNFRIDSYTAFVSNSRNR